MSLKRSPLAGSPPEAKNIQLVNNTDCPDSALAQNYVVDDKSVNLESDVEKSLDQFSSHAQNSTSENRPVTVNNSTIELKVESVNVAMAPVRSPGDLQKELRSLISIFSENSGDFATGGILPDVELPCFPHIEINDFGVLPLPLIKVTFESIKSLCKQSPYGIGEKTLVDTSVRNSFQLEPEKFEIKNKMFVNQISVLIEQKIKPALGLVGVKIYGKIYKLLIYESGGKFGEHRDTEKEDNMFGTLIIQLPSVFTGGDLVVKHSKSSRVYNNNCRGSSTHCMFVAHYASCPHELKEVMSGYRAVLVYSLCWEGNELKPSPYVASTNAVKLCNLLNEFMDCSDLFSWALEYEYSTASIRAGALDFFKGSDKNIVSGIKNALDYDRMQSGKNRWELYIATANKKVNEYGSCGGHYGRWSKCNGDCDGDFEEESHSIELTDFVPLTNNSDNTHNLKLQFDPKEDTINFGSTTDEKGYDSDEDFWGDKDIGTGCSGPSGNEGATRERWYQKMVLVMWRTDHAFAMKCKSSLSDGAAHVLDLLRKGDIEEGEKGLMFLWGSIQSITSESTNTTYLLDMCVILKVKNKAAFLLKALQKWGIPTENCAKVVADAAHQFQDEEHRTIIKGLIMKTHKSQMKHVLCCCQNITWLQPKEVIQLVIKYTLANTGNLSYGLRPYNTWPTTESDSKIPACTHILEYMYKKETFPETELLTLVSKIDCVSDMESAITFVVGKVNGARLDMFIIRFVAIASEKLKFPSSYKSINKTFNTLLVAYFVGKSLEPAISILVNAIMALTLESSSSSVTLENKQLLLKLLVEQITALYPEKENLPECLVDACRFRINYLEGIVHRGTPAMSWNQLDAVVPNHPQVQDFLRGPSRTFTYTNFNDLRHARNWASKHEYDRGCFMTLTPTGRGGSAAVEIVKTSKGFGNQVVAFNNDLEEYKMLLKIVPGQRNILKKKRTSEPRRDEAPKTVDVIVLD